MIIAVVLVAFVAEVIIAFALVALVAAVVLVELVLTLTLESQLKLFI